MKNKNYRGYSLAEILIAISLVGIGLLSVLGIYPFGLAHMRVMGDRAFVIQQAQAKMEAYKSMSYKNLNDLMNKGLMPYESTLTDVSGTSHSGYKLEGVIRDPGFAEKVLEIRLTIYWTERNPYGKSSENWAKSYTLYGYKSQGLQ
ncbi:MAG: prepilin-type N-terminal cleavage/methylation domain-containing protein [Candidatus Eremiobacterota bacterium]